MSGVTSSPPPLPLLSDGVSCILPLLPYPFFILLDAATDLFTLLLFLLLLLLLRITTYFF